MADPNNNDFNFDDLLANDNSSGSLEPLGDLDPLANFGDMSMDLGAESMEAASPLDASPAADPFAQDAPAEPLSNDAFGMDSLAAGAALGAGALAAGALGAEAFGEEADPSVDDPKGKKKAKKEKAKKEKKPKEPKVKKPKAPKEKRPSSPFMQKLANANPLNVFLAISAAALAAGILFFAVELASYDFKVKAKTSRANSAAAASHVTLS